MIETFAITDAITDLNEAHQRFNIQPTTDKNFFCEWQTDLPELTEVEKAGCDRLKNRYLYYAADGSICEGTVNAVMISPLLELLGFFDPPYKVRSEYFVRLTIQTEDSDQDSILRGHIDALVVQDQLWITLIEAKNFGFSVLQALPQTLAYMTANPQTTSPSFAMITTGEDYLFMKLVRQPSRYYAQSYKFTLLSDENNNLYRVARILKRITLTFV
jgi:hypothetical protein